MQFFLATATPWRPSSVLLVCAVTHLAAVEAFASDGAYNVGDRVMVDVNMASTPAYQSWKAGTVTAVQMWQGQISGIAVRTDDGREITTAPRFMRAGAAPAAAPAAASASAGNPASVPSSSSKPQAGDAGSGNCKVGLKVVDRRNRAGVVVRANGPSCYVKLEGSGAEEYYLQWMLKPASGADANAAHPAKLEKGAYACVAANGQAGTLKLVITNGTQYADGKGTSGTYKYEPASGRIQWVSGPWAGHFGTRLGPGKIGISSRPGGFANVVCDRK